MSQAALRPGGALAAGLLAALLAGAPGAVAAAPDTVAADPAAPAPAAFPAATPAAGAPTAQPAVAPSAAQEDIRDIRGPKFVLSAWMIAAAVTGAALLALAAYATWRWRQRRRRPRVLLPFEVALQQLDVIRPLMQPARAREFSIAVSDIVRGYIERRFEVTATHRTTEEFLHDLLATTKPSLARHRGLLAEFLQQCDLVKFGGMSLSLQSMESLHHSARAFVLETAKPDVAPPPREAHDSLPAT